MCVYVKVNTSTSMSPQRCACGKTSDYSVPSELTASTVQSHASKTTPNDRKSNSRTSRVKQVYFVWLLESVIVAVPLTNTITSTRESYNSVVYCTVIKLICLAACVQNIHYCK